MGNERRYRAGSGRAALLAVVAALAAGVSSASAATTTEPPAAPALAATLRLRVTEAPEVGRLVVKLAQRVILSVPLAALTREHGGTRQRDLSVPEGRHTLTVQMLDAVGRVIAQGIIHGDVAGPVPATLVVAEPRGSGAGLTLSWRTP